MEIALSVFYCELYELVSLVTEVLSIIIKDQCDGQIINSGVFTTGIG